MRCDAAYFRSCLLTFTMIVLRPSSGYIYEGNIWTSLGAVRKTGTASKKCSSQIRRGNIQYGTWLAFDQLDLRLWNRTYLKGRLESDDWFELEKVQLSFCYSLVSWFQTCWKRSQSLRDRCSATLQMKSVHSHSLTFSISNNADTGYRYFFL